MWRGARSSELKTRIAKHLSGRVRAPGACVMLSWTLIVSVVVITARWLRVLIRCTRKRFRRYKMYQQTVFVPSKTFPRYKIPRAHYKWGTQCPRVFPESRWVCSVLWNLVIKKSTWIIDGVAEVPAETRGHPWPRKWEEPAPAGGMSASEGLRRDLRCAVDKTHRLLSNKTIHCCRCAINVCAVKIPRGNFDDSREK